MAGPSVSRRVCGRPPSFHVGFVKTVVQGAFQVGCLSEGVSGPLKEKCYAHGGRDIGGELCG